jgi:DNA-binding transcriptional LysR family regulator
MRGIWLGVPGGSVYAFRMGAMHGRGKTAPKVNWDDLRVFLAVARQGSLSAAARTLKVTQPTASRRLAALENDLGSRLFDRTATGLRLSPSGHALLEHGGRIEHEILAAENAVSGHDADLRGRVLVACPEWLGAQELGARLGEFVARHPGIEIELLPGARHVSLSRREADVALRLARFAEPDVVERPIRRVAFGVYASESYLESNGPPASERQWAGHTLITMGGDAPPTADEAWLRAVAPRARVVWRSNGRHLHARVAATGAGLACLPRSLGDEAAGLRRIDATPPERTLWLGVHRDARALRRIRAVVDFVTA